MTVQDLAARVRHGLYDARLEPFLLTGGLYAVTALYYTRIGLLQVASAVALIAAASYWAFAIRRRPGLSWGDFKLTPHRLWMNILLAAGLAVFGWFWFSFYVHLTRGESISLGFGGSVPAVLTIIAVSVAEEFYFRGYLQNRLADRYGMWARVLTAVVAMAVYKNIVHLWEGMTPAAHVELLLIGILHNVLPSLWLEWSGSLVGPLFLHVFWDLLVYAPMSTIPYWVI